MSLLGGTDTRVDLRGIGVVTAVLPGSNSTGSVPLGPGTGMGTGGELCTSMSVPSSSSAPLEDDSSYINMLSGSNSLYSPIQNPCHISVIFSTYHYLCLFLSFFT